MKAGKLEKKEGDSFSGTATNDFEKRIVDVFLMFDTIGSRSIDIQDVPNVIRGLGCVPTEEELNEIQDTFKEIDDSGMVNIKRFIPRVGGAISEYKMEPSSAEVLTKAFRKMDKENKGYLTPEFLAEAITKEGECFSQDELKTMLKQAIDPDSGRISYEYYINQLLVNVEPTIYSLIPPPPPEEPKRR